MRTLAILSLTTLLNGCFDLPGSEGASCNQNGLCAPGLACSRDHLCVKTSTTCASDSAGLCYDSNFACGWFVGPYDASEAAEMCEIEPGSYLIGDPPTLQEITEAFYVDRFEVTNARYKTFYSSLSDSEKNQMLPTCSPGDRGWSSSPPYYDAQYEDHPVVCTNRPQAEAFCAWADKTLPDAIAWEATARGDNGRTYPWGEDPPAGMANCQNKAGDSDYCHDTYEVDTCSNAEDRLLCADTAPIFDPNGEVTLPSGASPSGNLHMAGNVWEWISDNSGTDGIIRGGSWYDFFAELETTSQREVSPTSHRKTTVGFRCAY